MVIEAKSKPAARSLTFASLWAPIGKTSASNCEGATSPTQFTASDQLSVVPPPSQVEVWTLMAVTVRITPELKYPTENVTGPTTRLPNWLMPLNRPVIGEPKVWETIWKLVLIV